MSSTVGLNVNVFLRNLIKAIGVVFFMFKLSWRMSVLTLIGLPCIIGVSKVFGNKFKVSLVGHLHVYINWILKAFKLETNVI